MKNLISGIALLAVCATALNAQQSRKIQFRTLCLEQVPGLEKVLLSTDKDPAKNKEISLYTDLSPVVEGVFKGDEAVFYTMKSGDDGISTRVEVGKTTMGNSDHQLFLFLPGGEDDGKLAYQVQAFDDDVKSFELGSIRAINLASLPVRFVMPESTLPLISPGGSAQFPHAKNADDYNMYPVSVEFQAAGGEWVKAQAVNWKANDRRREIIVMQNDGKSKQPTVKMFSDVPPWLNAPPKPARR